MFEQYYLVILGLGGVALLVVWLPLLLKRLPLSLPIVCIALGYVVFTLTPIPPGRLPPMSLAARVTEIVVVIALMGAGLKIDRPFSLRGWQTAWRLLGVAMPLTIVSMMLLAHYFGGFAWPGALLLAATLAPTDPVLASSVGVGPPGTGEEGEIRFGLTAEAGFNDGLAGPLVTLAILLTSATFTQFAGRWAGVDMLATIVGGGAVGWILGRVFGWLAFHLPTGSMSSTGDGLAVLALTFLCFGTVQELGLNGFIGVFVMAITFRGCSPGDRFHRALAEFAGQVESLLTMVILVFFGGTLALGLLTPIHARDIGLALLLILVVRPLTGWISLTASPHPRVSRALTAFFGIRGISTIFYLLHALSTARFADATRIAAVVGWAISGSILIHGVSSTPLMAWADRRRTAYWRANPERAPRSAKYSD